MHWQSYEPLQSLFPNHCKDYGNEQLWGNQGYRSAWAQMKRVCGHHRGFRRESSMCRWESLLRSLARINASTIFLVWWECLRFSGIVSFGSFCFCFEAKDSIQAKSRRTQKNSLCSWSLDRLWWCILSSRIPAHDSWLVQHSPDLQMAQQRKSQIMHTDRRHGE